MTVIAAFRRVTRRREISSDQWLLFGEIVGVDPWDYPTPEEYIAAVRRRIGQGFAADVAAGVLPQRLPVPGWVVLVEEAGTLRLVSPTRA